ncbi:MAG: hypothetical protein KF878_34275 [Planctomycetes bacterium]|nr:hypothetical protein [Planctomycetota bacterium]
MPESESGKVGVDLGRGACRAVVAGAGFAALASAPPAGLWNLWTEVPLASAALFGAVAAPCAALEGLALRRGWQVTAARFALAWVVVAAALAIAHLQAAYARGALAGVEGGLDAVWAEVARLRFPAPGELGELVGLSGVDLLSAPWAAAASTLTCSALWRPARATGPLRPWHLLPLALALGAAGVSFVVAGPLGALNPLHWFVVAPYLLACLAPALVVVAAAALLGDAAWRLTDG